MVILKYSFLFLMICVIQSKLENDKVSQINQNDVNHELIFTHIVFRHGERTPLQSYPTDPWRNLSNWPIGWGELTNEGKQQQYYLGRWLGKWYAELINIYSHDKVYIQSTDIDRTIMSAAANLAGLFPPTNNQSWNKYIAWQPIPIHTVPKEYDTTIGALKYCKAYDVAMEHFLNTDTYKNIDKQFYNLYEFLTKHSGTNVKSINDVYYLYDTLTVEQANNKTLPKWTKTVFYKNSLMEKAAMISYKLPTYTKELARLKSGFLLREILEHCINKIENKLLPDRVMWIYSGHDFTITDFLNALGLFKLHIPSYAATILIELLLIDNQPFIQLIYKNSTNSHNFNAIVPLEIPNCGKICSLKKFIELYDEVIPKNDYDIECNIDMTSSLKTSTSFVTPTVKTNSFDSTPSQNIKHYDFTAIDYIIAVISIIVVFIFMFIYIIFCSRFNFYSGKFVNDQNVP